VFRTLEARGEIRGGRFVAGFAGEQYALPDAVPVLRACRRDAAAVKDGTAPSVAPISVTAADPLNFVGILTPDERVASTARRSVRVA
jgi:ATP-dependent Lhr-like helicase